MLDYGSGNIRSAQRGLARTGAKVEVSNDLAVARDAQALVIPGVGAFAACAAALRNQGFADLIVQRANAGSPMLGICVGMQILFETGTESVRRDGEPANHQGLGVWRGEVNLIQAPVVPHMGWNTVAGPKNSQMFAGLDGERFYFVHSYAAKTWDGVSADTDVASQAVVTTCDYGDGFVAAIEAGPIWATQFHPEKSGEAGLRLLKNWVDQL